MKNFKKALKSAIAASKHAFKNPYTKSKNLGLTDYNSFRNEVFLANYKKSRVSLKGKL